LADFLVNGVGVTKSVTEALNLFHQSAELGNDTSQLILAARYKYGDELPRDYVKAYTYANLASTNTQNKSDKEAAIELQVKYLH
jgi:TPR repeat protein